MRAVFFSLNYKCTRQSRVDDLYVEPDTTLSEIIRGRLRWLGHVERMSEERTVKKVLKNILEGKMSVGRLRKDE
jgi:hypothetical protein